MTQQTTTAGKTYSNMYSSEEELIEKIEESIRSKGAGKGITVEESYKRFKQKIRNSKLNTQNS